MSEGLGTTASEAGGPMATWAAQLAAGQVKIQRCTACARHVFYPRRLCPYCASTALEWVEASGRGTVHATTVVARSAARGGDYNVALVDLEEGVRMMSRVDGIDAADVRIGMPVRASIVDSPSGPLLVFVPASG